LDPPGRAGPVGLRGRSRSRGSALGQPLEAVRAHGGDLAYEPRTGGGSCFILRLPVSTAEKTA
ncbi:MAG: hypothetical protein ABSF34_15410, partial [Verrucomicrobiota bacterium]